MTDEVKNLLLHKVYLGLGTNLGDRETNIQTAIRLIGERVGTVVRQSSLIETEPWGFESPNKFLNAVILCETERTPRQVLRLTQKIERDMGREKPIGGQSSSAVKRTDEKVSDTIPRRQYKDRPIDIDILLYDDITIDEPDLKIPHPLMYERDFVMIPLNEIRNNEMSK
jgi:2-amino-4-hydroxy-6-hydroxymethyldihydropteridine diphosphokinase